MPLSDLACSVLVALVRIDLYGVAFGAPCVAVLLDLYALLTADPWPLAAGLVVAAIAAPAFYTAREMRV